LGDVPEVIAVWPMADGGEPADDELWFSGLAAALRERGYHVMPPGITVQLLRDSDLVTTTSDEQAIGRALRADAVMRLQVRCFDADNSAGLKHAEWDLKWTLLSTRGQGELWSFSHYGNYQKPTGDAFDPGRRLEAQRDTGDIVPIGGYRSLSFRTSEELLAHLNYLAMSHLPKQ